MTPEEKKYKTVEARGEIRVLPRPDERVVGVNLFGSYARLTPNQARLLAHLLQDAAAEVAGFPFMTGERL